MLDFFMHGLRWFVGAFSFVCSLTLLCGLGCGLWYVIETWQLRVRRKILDVDAWMERAPEPWRGYTLTVLDARGRDLFSARVEEGYRVNGEVRMHSPFRASRYVLMHAGTVVREGKVCVLRREDFDIDGNRLSAPDLDTLECATNSWELGQAVCLKLPTEWFKFGSGVRR